MRHLNDWITPNWAAPACVKACTTTRNGGFSNGQYSSMNLGDRTNDSIISIAKNRNHLLTALQLPGEPCWLNQAHTNKIIRVDRDSKPNQQADASYCVGDNGVCAVLTADCLPVLLCTREGNAVAAVHAGWRGLVSGIIENAVSALMHFGPSKPENIMAWLGPAIGPGVFEVGKDVYSEAMAKMKQSKVAFYPLSGEKWLADIYKLARLRLSKMGVKLVFGGGYCTVTQYQKFYSYRRDKDTGRMASLIWIDHGDV